MEFYTLLITIAVSVAGWVIALLLQGRNIKHQHKVQVRYDIYKQFVQLHENIQNALSELGAGASTPFTLMESSMIPFNLNLKKEYKGIWLPYSEQECVFEGEKKWTNYVQEIGNSYLDLSGKYVSFLYIFEEWAAALNGLIPIKYILLKEIDRLQKIINEQTNVLRMYPVNNGHDWRKWDREEIENIVDNIKNSTYEIGSYLGDFMILVHNKLLAKYFKHKRLTRKTLDAKYKVLTIAGIIENVDKKKVRQMQIYKSKLLTLAQDNLDKSLPPKGTITPEYENFLRSITNGICPTCSNPIEVISMETDENSFCFNYICGHSWKGITIIEAINIKELYIIKIARNGVKWFRKIVQGWKSSGDPKLKHGVDVYMDVNREKNEYHQIVSDHQTKKTLHEEHELLTDHKIGK
jgi:hypothetical protein